MKITSQPHAKHGFRKGLSCDTQLVEFYRDIASSVNAAVGLTDFFFHFQKPFDTVPHALTVHKL